MSKSLRELCEPYLDDFYLMADRNKQFDGNAALYAGMRFVYLHKLGELVDEDTVDFRRVLDICEFRKGLINRAYKADWESHDDYEGLLAASYFVETKCNRVHNFADNVYQQGKNNWYCWNNLNPGKWIAKGFFVRQPGFWALVKASSGRRLNLFDQLMVCVDILSTLYKDDGFSGYNMDFLTIEVLSDEGHNYWLTNKAIKYFRAKFLERYPDGIGHAKKEFFNAEYPLAVALKGKI